MDDLDRLSTRILSVSAKRTTEIFFGIASKRRPRRRLGPAARWAARFPFSTVSRSMIDEASGTAWLRHGFHKSGASAAASGSVAISSPCAEGKCSVG